MQSCCCHCFCGQFPESGSVPLPHLLPTVVEWRGFLQLFLTAGLALQPTEKTLSTSGFPMSPLCPAASASSSSFFLKKTFYLFTFREKGREKERERNINVWLPLMHPLLGTWPATKACALTGNQTGDPLVCRPALNPLSHTCQGISAFFYRIQRCVHQWFLPKLETART